MKNFDDFRATLTEEVRIGISKTAASKISEIEETESSDTNMMNLISTTVTSYTLSILELYHSWLQRES